MTPIEDLLIGLAAVALFTVISIILTDNGGEVPSQRLDQTKLNPGYLLWYNTTRFKEHKKHPLFDEID